MLRPVNNDPAMKNLTTRIEHTISKITENCLDGSSQSCDRTGLLAFQALKLHLAELKELYNGDEKQIKPEILAAIKALRY